MRDGETAVISLLLDRIQELEAEVNDAEMELAKVQVRNQELEAALREIEKRRFCEYVDVDPWTKTKDCFDRGREPCPYCRARQALQGGRDE